MQAPDLEAWERGDGLLAEVRLVSYEPTPDIGTGSAHLGEGGGSTQRGLRPEEAVQHDDGGLDKRQDDEQQAVDFRTTAEFPVRPSDLTSFGSSAG